MQRRRFLLFTLVPVTGIAIAAACGFPDPKIDDGTEGGPGIDGGNDADVATSDGASNDGKGAFDGDFDAFVETDGGSKIDAANCDARVNCDCDGDGYHHLTVDGGVQCDASVAQGNIDCEDDDTRYRPNQKYLEIPGEAPHNGDWNCKGGVEKLYENVNIQCGKRALGNCAGVTGFTTDPACGEEGTFVECTVENLALCTVLTSDKRKQACR